MTGASSVPASQPAARAVFWTFGVRSTGVGGPRSTGRAILGAAEWAAFGAFRRGLAGAFGAAVGAGVAVGAGGAAFLARGTGASGNGLRASAASACAVTHTGVWRLVRE